MKIHYTIALVNYKNYPTKRVPSLERAIEDIKEQGMGVELWRSFADEPDLYSAIGMKRLKPLLEDIDHISMHGFNSIKTEDHRLQIDVAANLGATVLVIHDDTFIKVERLIEEATQVARGTHNRLTIQLERKPEHYDLDLLKKFVDYGGQKGVTVALENGVLVPPYDRLSVPLEQVAGLKICLDTGHLNRPWLPDGVDPMTEFVTRFKNHIVHLHVHDSFRETEADDHVIPGHGGTPDKSWQLLADALREVEFEGMAALEIGVHTPLMAANVSRDYLKKYL